MFCCSFLWENITYGKFFHDLRSMHILSVCGKAINTLPENRPKGRRI